MFWTFTFRWIRSFKFCNISVITEDIYLQFGICVHYPHTDQHGPRTPDVLDTPDQIFHKRNGGGVSIFIFYGPD